MFLDRITLQIQGGKGGDGAVHFARVKFQAFAGPDGGDGGSGGSVVFLADRNIDSFNHLRTCVTTAKNGEPGGENQKYGVTAPDLEIRVPVGTFMLDSTTGNELASFTANGQEFRAARGGDGGKGNPKYATGRRRTPRIAEAGAAGESLAVDLIYRLYCDTALVEPSGDTAWQLLPSLIGKENLTVDWDLYQRRPRWLRLEHDFKRYDCGYIPAVVSTEELAFDAALIGHVYWARHICVNLCPCQDASEELQALALAMIRKQDLARLERVTLLCRAGAAAASESISAGVQVQVVPCASADEAHEALLRQLTGGIVG